MAFLLKSYLFNISSVKVYVLPYTKTNVYLHFKQSLWSFELPRLAAYDNTSNPLIGLIKLIQLLRVFPLRLYWAGRLMEYSLVSRLSSWGKVSFWVLKTSELNLFLIIRVVNLHRS